MKVRALPTPLHVGFVSFSMSRGGLELMLVRIAAALQRDGHSVVFVCPPGSPLSDECKKAHLPYLLLSPTFKYLDFRIAATMAGEFSRSSVDILVVGNSRDISTAVLAKLLHKGMRIVYVQQMQSGLDKRDLFHRWTYRRLDRWVTLTQAMKESTIRTTIVKEKSIEVVPFGADLARFRPARFTRRQSRKSFNLPPGKTVIAVPGRFDPQKGQEYFLEAAPSVLRALPHAHFVLAGEETHGEEGYRQKLNAIVQQHQLARHVQFIPFTDDVPRLLSAVDLVVLPSLSETFGYLAVEAMAMGIPVIGTKAGGLPEIIEDGKTGFLVPPRNSEQLALRITQVLKDTRLYNTMSKRSRTRVTRYFDFQKNIDAFENLLRRLPH